MPDPALVGKIGSIFAKFSLEYFGYLAYGYLLVFLYPLYKLNFNYMTKVIEKSITFIFLFLTLIIFQALVVTDNLSGKIGDIIISTLSPFIGLAGLWLFVLIGTIVSFYVFVEDFDFKMKFDNLKKKIQFSTNKISKSKSSTNKLKKLPKQKVIVKETGNTAEIILEDIKDEKSTDDITTSSIIVDELEENKKLLEDIETGDVDKPQDFELPHSDFFNKPPKQIKNKVNEAVIDQKINDLLEKLAMFKIEGDVVRTYSGPIVTTFEFKPAPNVKVSKILNLQDDLAMALKAQTIRIQAPIPGKDVVGIEVPNENFDTIYMREILESELFQNSSSPLTIILGKDIVGRPFITDLKKLPHLLIAGTTGSGKSVGINGMILSLLYKNSPDDLKMIMIDPKMLEFSMYNDIPHLLTPVITKPMEAINALASMVAEMERRYMIMAQSRTKNIENYNEKAKKGDFDKIPYIVIIIDELADLMMTSGKEVEVSIARIAQKARACGIHLIVATQRPSVDVVTGLIKANLPSRISYKVGQKVDSKIILDGMGAESLLGRGDLLFTPPGMSGLVRIHAPWTTEDEIDKVVYFLKSQREVQYNNEIVKEQVEEGFSGRTTADVGELDSLYEDAKRVVIEDKKSSISYIQRKLRIGYNRSATIVEQLEMTGVLSAANTKGNREILI
ncbi:MAG: DNA translocase FtsK 4TM domain-containing protein [Arcobacteraceae bacterium]|nr:DNA translocase FtsK 4TM domain-containing protein [Arcobacteraceae bacterium]